ncbi:hypothetical protein MSPP1_000390 [Malassezia sp. CBS 17886]|nr:hypothetical protein MSPP1_000390 [Malassezia sp. CBS 17886]
MSTRAEVVQQHHEKSTHVDESLGRYTAYAMRLRTLLVSSSRYIAYSSDVGEAFRPLTKPIVVSAAYGISWAYIFSDVGYTCYKACHTLSTDDPRFASDVAWIASRRAVFQTLASLILPAATIHSVVRYSAPIFARSKSVRVKSAGPTLAGLLTVPLLPVLFDHPVEYAVENAFDWIETKVAALQHKPSDAGGRAQRMGGAEAHDRAHTTAEKLARPVDQIPTAEAPELAKLAMLGIGVDLVFLPRFHQLFQRHAQRLARMPWQRVAAAAVPRTAEAAKPDEARPGPGDAFLAAAAQHFARRTLSAPEAAIWANASPRMTRDDCVSFLASRWASKEAAYKAAYPHVRLAATDVTMVRAERAHAAKPRLILEPRAGYVSAGGAGADEAVSALHLELSLSHDGDYVVAAVLAHSES